MKEKTIEKSVSCYGIGLHSGKKVGLTFRPYQAGGGIVFKLRHSDGAESLISCRNGQVANTTLATTLCSEDGKEVQTVEHVLAAIRGVGIDNVLVEVEGGEVPIMDGSAFPFVYLLRQAGVQEQNSTKKAFRLLDKVEVTEGNARIVAKPASESQITYHIDFSHPLIAKQTFCYKPCADTFVREVAKARTFGFAHQVEELKKAGLIKGGSLDNAVVFGETEVLNPVGLRYADEPVRHKMLDFIGDIGLLGYDLLADMEVYCSGHSLNNSFVRKLRKNKQYLLSLVDYPDKKHSLPELQGNVQGAGLLAV